MTYEEYRNTAAGIENVITEMMIKHNIIYRSNLIIIAPDSKEIGKTETFHGIRLVKDKRVKYIVIIEDCDLENLDNISELVLMDDYYIPKLKHLYKYFDEVIFFPSVKKTRLIECKSIDKPVGWKE